MKRRKNIYKYPYKYPPATTVVITGEEQRLPKAETIYQTGAQLLESIHIKRGCQHDMQAVNVGKATIYASAYLDTLADAISNPKLDMHRTFTIRPTLGIYFDNAWSKNEIVLQSPGVYFLFKPKITRTQHQRIILNWPDMGTFPIIITERAVLLAYRSACAGKIVEIGCLGGHGRTGTFLACMIVYAEGVSPEVAIKEVKARYCKKAVESASQREMITQFWKRRKNN